MSRAAAPAGDRALPALAGLLLALSFPPARLLLPVFIGLAPLLIFIAALPPGPAGRWRATRGGLLTGAVFFGIQLYWLLLALIRYSALAIPAYLGAVLVLTGLAGAFGWAVHLTRERLGLPLPILAALFWTLLEWAQAHLGDLAFPWLGLGAALAPFPTLAGAADLVGARGLTVWIAALNGLVASAVVRARAHRRAWPPLAAAAILFALPGAYGALRAATLPLRPAARVALVQPNIPEDVKRDPRIALDSSLTALTALTARLDTAPPVDLVVWPEVALPAELEARPSLRRTVRRLARQAGAPILVGAYGGGETALYNSAFLVSPDNGPLSRRYDKRRLVPFIERVPFVGRALFVDRAGSAGSAPGGIRRYGGLERGGDPPALMTDAGTPFGVLICYESIFAPLSRQHRREGAELLVNITNDAWYGREEWWGRTPALWQHPAHMVMRAIETRSGVARAANTGFSMIIDPVGRVHHRTPLFQPTVVVGTVHTTDERTLFVRWGDWLAGTVAGLAALTLLGSAIRAPAALHSRLRRGRTRRSGS